MKIMDEMVIVSYLRKQLQEMMSDLVGIVRSNRRLNMALQNTGNCSRWDEIYHYSILSPQLSELRNLTTVAHLIITQSMEMTENKGAFYNKDLA